MNNEIEPPDKKYRNVCCVNCGERGHVIKECAAPITSFGIIAFKVSKDDYKDYNDVFNIKYSGNEDVLTNKKKIKFLMIQRKDTMGYIDLIRGKYPEEKKDELLSVFMNEMTIEEKHNLLTKEFTDIWNELWLNKNSRLYKNEYYNAKLKYEKLDIKKLLKNSTVTYDFTEFSFPKGRRNIMEQNIQCAEREFFEETRYNKTQYNFIYNYKPIVEDFVGTNGIKYRHVYYLVKMNDDIHKPYLDKTNILQMGEVKNIGWFSYEECMFLIRPYDQAKKDILSRVYKDILNMNGNYKYNIRIPSNNNRHFSSAFDWKSKSI
jgi:ADP-ribose pyrophosphatase YjhB (NUDIX family)